MLKKILKFLLFLILFSIFVCSTVIVLERHYNLNIPILIQTAPFILLSFYLLFGNSSLFFGSKPNPKWLVFLCKVIVANVISVAIFAITKSLNILEGNDIILIFVFTLSLLIIDSLYRVIREKGKN